MHSEGVWGMVWREDGKHLGSEHSTANPNRARMLSVHFRTQTGKLALILPIGVPSLYASASFGLGRSIGVSDRYQVFYVALSSAYLQDILPL